MCGGGSRTNAEIGATTCSPCDPGTYSAGSDCTPCGAGKFSFTGQSSCVLCDAGKYSQEPGSASCTPCSRGEGSISGSSSCAESATGYYLYRGVAAICPSHATCEGGTAMPRPLVGYWVERRSLFFSNTIYKCPRLTCDPSFSSRTRRLLVGADSDCWNMAAYDDDDFDHVICIADELLCKDGAFGPLCGSCKDSFIYSSTERVCIACSHLRGSAFVVLGLAAGAVLLVACFFVYTRRVKTTPYCLTRSWLWGVFRELDSGDIRVAWANYQIIQSASWSLDVEYPSPFKETLSALSIFSFDFLSLECMFHDSNHFVSVYLWSTTPIVLAVLLFISHAIEGRCSFGASNPTTSTLTYRLLLLCYLVLPPVSLKQLQALDCVNIAEGSYVRIDTSIDCNSDEFKTFLVLDILFIAIYLATPLVWFALLFRERKRLNPLAGAAACESGGRHAEVLELALGKRDSDTSLLPLRFLFSAYQPSFYYMECVEMYRRILFVGILPLLTAASSRRAALGLLFSLCSVAFYGELTPFLRSSTNLLAYVAQYANLLTFGAGLAIEVGMDQGLDPFLFGSILVLINIVVVGLIFRASVVRFMHGRAAQQSRRPLTPEELHVVKMVMSGKASLEDESESFSFDNPISAVSDEFSIEMVERGGEHKNPTNSEARSVN